MRILLLIVILGISFLGISQIFAADGYSFIRVKLQPAAIYMDGEKIASGDRNGYFHNGTTYVPGIIEYQGTMYVPVKMISKPLNKQVGWDDKRRILWMGANPGAATTKSAAVPANEKQAIPATAQPAQAAPETSLFGITLGMTEQQVLQKLGPPARREPGSFGYDWWVYNQHLDRYLQVGIRAGKVVDIYSNAPLARIGHVSVGTSYQSLTGKQEIKRLVSFSYQGASIQITNQTKERPLALHHDIPIIYYLDTQNELKVTAMRMIDKLVLLQGGFYETKWTYQGEAPHFDPLPLTIKQRELVNAAHERQLLDLTNVIRYRYKLPPLAWHQPAAQVARSHSQDMENSGYFNHVSSTTGLDPFQRLKKAGITYQMAGENIAAGFPDAIEAHENWMNSPGHRKNLLEKGFTRLGVGVYADYYTEDFLTLTK
jgi:uncharacterized protein YkwD